jgi:hypothetical protein
MRGEKLHVPHLSPARRFGFRILIGGPGQDDLDCGLGDNILIQGRDRTARRVAGNDAIRGSVGRFAAHPV